ncbi:hypothetical protein Tco_0378918 [Tanacetum coccineum]
METDVESIGNHFLMETEVESMVTIPIHQASSSAPPLSTPIIDLIHPKPLSPPGQEQVFTATTATTATTTTTLLPPPPPQQQSTIDPVLVNYVFTLEEICANLLLEFEMKEILHDWMFESGSYKSHPEHITLYEALEASIDRESREEFVEAMAKSQAPSSSSKQKTTPQSEQPVNDVPIPDDVHISDSEDTVAAYLSKIKTRPNGLNHVPKEERSETPEPDWAVPPNDLPKTEKNWANAIANAYKDLEENKLIWKTGDMGSFIKWYCKQIRKSKLNKANLEGPAFKIDLVNPDGNRVVPNDLEYLISSDKERRNALSISKLKAAYYPDFGLEELVPSLWIESERKYNISAAYEDYTIVHKPRAVIYRDRNDHKKMTWENEVHKFSDVKPGMEHRIWSEDDKRRSKEFIEVIERRLKIRRIFMNLESFVSGRLRDVDYRLIQRTE